MKKSQESSAKKLTIYELRRLIKEEYGRGIPDFAVSTAATNCVDEMKLHMVRFVQQRNLSAVEQRQLLVKANESLKKMEQDIKKVIEENLLEFLYRV